MIIQRLVPRVDPLEVEDLLVALRGAPRSHAEPFHPVRVAFSEALSRAIFRHPRAREFPEVLAVAFWLRRAEVARLAQRFERLGPQDGLRAPRGLVFHLPPTNVDTLFLYPLMASLLLGNLNVVRISRAHPGQQVALLCEALRAVLEQERFAELADELAVVAYGHEPEPTAALSREADVRLLWGGDDTVARLRAVPLGPGGHELTFGDRFSFALLRPEAVLAAEAEHRRRLAQSLFNDAYWFDQLACSSPRLLVWVGPPEPVEQAAEALVEELAQVVAAKGYRLEPGAVLAKLTFAYRAFLDRRVKQVRRPGNELFVLHLADLDGFDRTHPGAGLFFEARVDALSDLVPFVRRQDQTVTAYGFSSAELTAFARALRGRGVDRIVPFGNALSFASLWDGYDLLAELTRTVDIAVRV